MRKLQYVFMALAALCFAIPAFADGGSAAINWCRSAPVSAWAWRPVFAALVRARPLARPWKRWPATPGARGGIFTFLVLGLALIESLTLFTLVIVFTKM